MKTQSKSKKWDYSSIKNFPEGGTIQRSGDSLIVIRRKSVYDPSIGRGKDASREYLGRVVDNVFYTVEEYKLKFQRGGVPRRVPLVPSVTSLGVPSALDKLTTDEIAQLLTAEIIDVYVGIVPILHRIAVERHIMQDLRDSFGAAVANFIFCIVAFHICTGNNAARGFEDWVRNRHLPEGMNLLNGRDISNIYAQIGSNPKNIERYFLCRAVRNKNAKLVLSTDSTTISCGCTNANKAFVSKNKQGQYESQIKMVITFNTATHEPIFYRVIPGNINDCQTVLELMTRLDEYNLNNAISAASLDRGYYSEENLLVAHDTNINCIFATKTNIGWIADCIDKARPMFLDSKKGATSLETTLRDGVVQGVTIEKRIKVNGTRFAVYVHVFKSDRNASYERERFFKSLNQFESLWDSKLGRTAVLRKESYMKYFNVVETEGCAPVLTRDKVAIEEAIKNYGIFVSVTTWRCTAQECYDSYGYRCDIERVFRSGKSDVNMNVQRTHNDTTIEGKNFINFIELAILEELKQRLASDHYKTLKNGKKRIEIAKNTYDIDEIINGLRSVAYSRRKSNGDIICREVIEKQHAMAIACGCKGIFQQPYTYQ